VDILRNVLLTIHLLGMAVIVGAFIVQMRANSGFRTGLMLGGAITQVVSGVALVGLAFALGNDVDHVKLGVKGGIAIVVLVAAIVALVQQRRGGKVKPWFHAAGGLAFVNVLVAALWN